MAVPRKNIGAAIKAVECCAGRLVAAGTGDATKVTGKVVDRMAPGVAGYLSCVVAIVAEAVLTASKTLAFAAEIAYSSDGTNFDTAVALQTSTVLLTDSGSGSTIQGCVQFDIDLSAQKRYFRINPTPDLNHTSTDTAHWACVAILGGADSLPV